MMRGWILLLVVVWRRWWRTQCWGRNSCSSIRGRWGSSIGCSRSCISWWRISNTATYGAKVMPIKRSKQWFLVVFIMYLVLYFLYFTCVGVYVSFWFCVGCWENFQAFQVLVVGVIPRRNEPTKNMYKWEGQTRFWQRLRSLKAMIRQLKSPKRPSDFQ